MTIPLQFVRNPRARRYYLRVRSDGSARVTIPRGGSLAEAHAFAQRNQAWIEKTRARLAARPIPSRAWTLGTQIYFRGELVELRVQDGRLCLGELSIALPGWSAERDLRPGLERLFRALAQAELPPLVQQLAAAHGLAVSRVTVRGQKSRWGSCSSRGTISLNWRLIQAPAFARDYVIVHELMHLKQMNHSDRFWREVALAFPNHKDAERWLRAHGEILR